LHVLQTNFDFAESNIAVQKTLNRLKELDVASGGQSTHDDDWEQPSTSKTGSKYSESESAAGIQRKNVDCGYAVTAVSWNCNGTALAVAYGKTNHKSWCECQSVVSIWSVFRREFDPKKPTINIEVSNCLTEVNFHPSDPLLLAGGTMNGEIIIWNIDDENPNPQLYISAIDEYFHREAITKLLWVKHESIETLAVHTSLVSTSTDGKILVWRLEDKLRFPVKGHMMTKKGADIVVMGGTALDTTFIMNDTTYFAGTEGGQLFKCTITQPSDSDISAFFDSSSGVRWKQEAINVMANLPKKNIGEVRKRVERYVQDSGKRDVYAPTVYEAKPKINLLFPHSMTATFEKHLGPCTGISCSPFLKRLFLSCSTDGSVRLYDMSDTRPMLTFEPGYNEYLTKVAWSPFRPTVFVTISNTGTVYIYDLILSKQTPSYILEYKAPPGHDAGSSQKTAYSVAFNPVIRDFLAVGYHDGSAKIYQLNYSLSRAKKDEVKILKSFMEEKEQ